MGIKQTFKNIFSGKEKTKNSVSGRDFLKYGSMNPLYPSWTEVKMSDEDMYRGYSYAVIQKRGNKVASLAKSNIKTDAKPEIVDAFQKKGEDVIHPYLKVLRDSVAFSEKQFWKNISIYLDLAGRYYLGVIRNEVRPNNPSLPVITTDVQGFVLLNPYEIRRVKNKDNELAGYIERKKDGRYREWPIYQIIEIKELNPFDNDKEWGMTDAAREAVYTLQQSGDYTRQTLNGNLDAPGIISTDVILEDEDFMNFRERIREHRKGEPIFGNGAGAIQWSSMQIDLDRAALLDINEINRTALFAVSGTSKTSLGIEQSGTTRDTARVQSEQFLADTVTPRLEDIIDYLNLDYRRHYKQEYEKSGFELSVLSASSRDYSTETQATQMRQAQVNLALGLIQSGYTAESAYQYAEGVIDLSDLELKEGLSEPQSPDAGQEGDNPDGNGPVSPSEAPQGGSGAEDGKDSVEEQNDVFTGSDELVPHKELNDNGGGNPYHDPSNGQFTTGHGGKISEEKKRNKETLLEDAKKLEHWVMDELDNLQDATSDAEEIVLGGKGKRKSNYGQDFYDDTVSLTLAMEGIGYDARDVIRSVGDKNFETKRRSLAGRIGSLRRQVSSYEEKYKALGVETDSLSKLVTLSKEALGKWNEFYLEVKDSGVLKENNCSCKHLNSVEDYIELSGQGEEIREAYNRFLAEVRSVQRKTIKECEQNVTINAFTEPDLLPAEQKNSLIKRLKNAVKDYWMVLFPLFANDLTEKRNREFNENTTFKFNNELQEGVLDNADTVASGHIETILGDILEASNKAYTKVLEDAASEMIIEAYRKDPSRFDKYFKKEPSKRQAKKAIENTDILEENRRIYEKANKMALEGYKNSDITKAIRKEYNHISKSRADLIAMNETSRAFSHSQYEADKQFLNSIGKLDVAYKQLYSRTGDPCPICQKIIDMGPIPFTKNFLDKGETISADENGKVRNFTANYEAIKGGTVHVRCYARDTMLYTNEGWKRVDEITGKELFWSINPETKKGEWVKAKRTIKTYAETLLRFKNKNLDMAVTHNHNMYVESNHRNGKGKREYRPELKEAQFLANKDRFYGGVVWEGEEPETIRIGNYDVPVELYVKFMGYYLSEGSANYYDYKKSYQMAIHQEKYHDRFWNDLSKMPFKLWNGEKAFTTADESVVKYCMQFGKSFEKYIPDEVKNLSPRLLRMFLDAYILGDGSVRFTKSTKSWKRTIATSSIKMRDDLTEVIQKAGYRPSVRLDAPKGTPYKGTNYVSNHDVWRISLNNRLYTYKEYVKVTEIPYHDDVFCVELEKNHTLWAMYNGKCWWSGNCQCEYRLTFKNELGEFITYNQVETKNAVKDATGRLHSEKDGKFVEKSGEGKVDARKEFSKLKEITNWTDSELQYVIPYFGSFENTAKVQEYLSGGDESYLTPTVSVVDCVNYMKRKMDQTTFPEDTTLYRGMMIRNDRMERVEKNGFSYPGFQSTTLVGNDASRIIQEYRDSGRYDKQLYTPVLLKINAKKGGHFASSYTDGEHEIVLPDNMEFKVKNKKPTSWGAVIYEVDYE